jgi:DNA modification methylase
VSTAPAASRENDVKACAALATELWAIERVIPYARNPRKNAGAVAKVAASIQEFGFRQPIVIDATGVIVVGHTRLLAAQQLGLEAVPVHVASSLTPAQAKAYRIMDNRSHEGSEWDEELLPLELGDLRDEGFDLDLTGFDAKELQRIFPPSETEGRDVEPQIDRADELRERWGVEAGQLWALGGHRMLCGDAAKAEDVGRMLGEDRPCLVFADPPYGVSIGEKNRLIGASNTDDLPLDTLPPAELGAALAPAFRLVRERMAEDCTVFVTAPLSGEIGMTILLMMRKAGLPVRHVLVWKKNAPTFSMGRLDYDYQHEPILLTWGKRHKRPMLGKHRTSVWEIDRPRASVEHPTMKPVELVENALLNNSDTGDVVYDPFHGSGTTLIACENLGRRCRAIEISPAYVAVAIQRWHELTWKTPELVREEGPRAPGAAWQPGRSGG